MSFDKKLDLALKKALIKEDTRPSEGIWYYVWLKPKWVLYAFKATEFGDMTHLDVWSSSLADVMAKHYKINPDQIINDVDSLRNAHCCMPRGRVWKNPEGKWIFGHGNDFPIDTAKAMKVLPASFELTKEILNKNVTFRFEEHETMEKEDMLIVQALIGKVPY